MTEIERAIEAMQYLSESSRNVLFKSLVGHEEREQVLNSIRLAITALREQQERKKGCEHCRQGKEIYVMQYGEQIAKSFIHTCSDGDALFIEGDDMSYIDLDYCPKCGRPFLELPKED